METYSELKKQAFFLKVSGLTLTTVDGENITLDLTSIGKSEFQYRFLDSFIRGVVSRRNIFFQDLDSASKKLVMDEFGRITAQMDMEKDTLMKKVNQLTALSLQLGGE